MRFRPFLLYQSLHKNRSSNVKVPLRSPSSTHKHSLSTSNRNALPTSSPSTVQIGTDYEHLCAHTLPRLGFKNITRTGGRSDRGIDLLAYWVLPTLSSNPNTNTNSNGSLHAIIQCKALTRKPSPEMVRELEGAVAGAPSEWRDENTIGVLCAKREATEGVRQAVRRSKRGMVWVMVEDLGEGRGGRVKQVVWNERVGRVVGERVGAGVRYVRGDGGMEKEVGLMVDGVVWEPEAEEGEGS